MSSLERTVKIFLSGVLSATVVTLGGYEAFSRWEVDHYDSNLGVPAVNNFLTDLGLDLARGETIFGDTPLARTAAALVLTFEQTNEDKTAFLAGAKLNSFEASQDSPKKSTSRKTAKQESQGGAPEVGDGLFGQSKEIVGFGIKWINIYAEKKGGEATGYGLAWKQEMMAKLMSVKTTETGKYVFDQFFNCAANACGFSHEVKNGINFAGAGGSYQFMRDTYQSIMDKLVQDGVVTDPKVINADWRDPEAQTVATIEMIDGKGMSLSDPAGFVSKFQNLTEIPYAKSKTGKFLYTCWNQSPSQAQSVLSMAKGFMGQMGEIQF